MPRHLQITEFFSFPIFYYIAAGYTGLVIIHAVITTRDGYCISLSNQLAARWVPRAVRQSWRSGGGKVGQAMPPVRLHPRV